MTARLGLRDHRNAVAGPRRVSPASQEERGHVHMQRPALVMAVRLDVDGPAAAVVILGTKRLPKPPAGLNANSRDCRASSEPDVSRIKWSEAAGSLAGA